MPDIAVRPVTVGDVPAVVAMFRASFSPALLPFMIYGQDGIDAFIRNSLPREGLAPQREFLVATDNADGRVLGFADFDVRDAKLPHLAYICVDSAARRRGIASELIHGYLASRSDAPEFLSLDVFDSNHGARHLYDRLGFKETGQRTPWFERALPAATAHGSVMVPDFIGVLASHDMYGFSMSTVVNGENSYRIGRLGGQVLRFGDAAAFADENLLSVLRRLFPSARTALLISDEQMPENLSSPVRQILTSIRMRLSLAREEHRRS